MKTKLTLQESYQERSQCFKNESYEYAYYLLSEESHEKANLLGIFRGMYTQKNNELAKRWITYICEKLNAHDLDENIKRLALKEAARKYKWMHTPLPKKRTKKSEIKITHF